MPDPGDEVFLELADRGYDMMDEFFLEERTIVADLIEQAHAAAHFVAAVAEGEGENLEDLRARAEDLVVQAEALLVNLRDRLGPDAIGG